MWRQTLVGVLAGVSLLWVGLLAFLWRAQPDSAGLRDAVRLLPDVVRLISRLARDPSLPRGLRVRLWLLLGYLAVPMDLVPDFIPVIGYADDAVLVVWILRSVVRLAGTAPWLCICPAPPTACALSERSRGWIAARDPLIWRPFGRG